MRCSCYGTEAHYPDPPDPEVCLNCHFCIWHLEADEVPRLTRLAGRLVLLPIGDLRIGQPGFEVYTVSNGKIVKNTDVAIATTVNIGGAWSSKQRKFSWRSNRITKYLKMGLKRNEETN
jgi:hypothetical protein